MKAAKKRVHVVVGRDARTGRFIPLAVARRRKSCSVVERVRRK
jgi:hypothetical protein